MDRTGTTIEDIYGALHARFGPQGWWPIVDADDGTCTYGLDAPRNDAERFEILVGCILTQNTQWDPNAVRAIHALKKGKKLSPVDLAKADASTIAPLIRSAGYYNQKAERLCRIASFWQDNPSLFDLPLAKLRALLLAQHGIGPETADSIILFAAGKPSFVVDAYTRRIMSRVGICKPDISYGELQAIFHDTLAPNIPFFKEYHALLVELAKRHCKTRPLCGGCPLAHICKKEI